MLDFLAQHHRLLAALLSVGRLVAILALVVAVFAPIEAIISLRPAKLFQKGWSLNLGWYFVNGLLTAFLLSVPMGLIAWLAHALIPAAVTDATAALPLWARMTAAMAVGEIGFYWGHRWTHEIKWLWRFHAVHHSAEHVNFLVTTRGHPVDIVFTRLCGMTLLYATGLTSVTGAHPELIPSLVLFLGSLWGWFIHANVRLRLGPLERLIATPAFHHWHHTFEDHKDRNYAPMLPFMDMVFGTFYLPKTWPERYGTDTYMPDTLVGQLIEPIAPTPASKPEAASAGT
jgi:sterol desaturase/sphingolipid hydroxylase (fatty acid hydroxylase superfamily)